jgi:integrase
VPRSGQALGVLRTIHFFTGNNVYVFPSNRGKDRPISDITINAALQRMGYNTREEITAHGFRAMARTLLHEKLRFPPEVIEHQLSHAVPDILGEAYNRTRFIDERKRMMQAWADYLDKLKELK